MPQDSETPSEQPAQVVPQSANEPAPSNQELGLAPQPAYQHIPGSQDLGLAPPQPAVIQPTPQPAPAVPQPARRAPVNYQPNEPGWWLATDGLWYPPETHPDYQAGASGTVVSHPGAGAQTVVVQVGAQAPQSGPSFVTSPPKSKVAGGLLAIFFGFLGVHRFYLGYTGIGVLMLVMSLTLFLLPITILWAWIEGIVILCGGMRDRWGRALT